MSSLVPRRTSQVSSASWTPPDDYYPEEPQEKTMPIPVTTGKVVKPIKLLLYGSEGVGKSTWASKWPAAVFIDTEGGTDRLDVTRLRRPTNWRELVGYLKGLAEDQHEFQTVVLDTADWAERLCADTICAEANKKSIEEFGYGKGYTYLAEEFGKMLRELDRLRDQRGMNVVVLAHAAVKKLELPEEAGAFDHWELKCSKQVSPLLKEWAEALLFAHFRVTVVKTEDGKARAIGGRQRICYATHTAAWDAKNRFDLPDEMPLDFAALAKHLPQLAEVKQVPKPKPPPKPKDKPEDEPPPFMAPDQKPPATADLEPTANVAASFPAPLYDALTAADIKPETLEQFLRAKKLIGPTQAIDGIPDAFVEKLLKPVNWTKIVTACKNIESTPPTASTSENDHE